MGERYEEIDADLQAFIEAQHMYFVATAPIAAVGHVNLSPKGLDTFRVLTPRTAAYLDYVGSGAETIAHLKENGRIVIMFCAFQGPPKIIRLHGRGAVLQPLDPEYQRLRPLFPAVPSGRAIITSRFNAYRTPVASVFRFTSMSVSGLNLRIGLTERAKTASWRIKLRGMPAASTISRLSSGRSRLEREIGAVDVSTCGAVTRIEESR